MSSDNKYISPEQQEEFEKFLLHQMNLEEETLFNEKLNADSKLKNKFEEFKTLFFAVEEEGLRNALNEFHKALPKKKNNFTFYRIAAGFAVIISLGIWLFNGQSPNEKLFKEYFTPDPGLPTVMGTNDNYAFYEAMVDYKRGNYDTAIKKWQRLLKTKPENDSLNYYIGISYLSNNNTPKAIFFLDKVAGKKSVFESESRFYLALGYLKLDSLTQARENLKLIDSETSNQLLRIINHEE